MLSSTGVVTPASAAVGQSGKVSSNAAVVVGAMLVSVGGSVSPTGSVWPGARVGAGGCVATAGCRPAVMIESPEPQATNKTAAIDNGAARLTPSLLRR